MDNQDSAQEPQNTDKSRSKLKAHIFDSDPVAIKMLKTILESIGLKVSLHNFKLDLVQTLLKISPDFLISELEFPGQEGSAGILEYLQNDRRFSQMKIVVCSQLAETAKNKLFLRKIKIDRAYLKPLDVARFARDIKHLMAIKDKQVFRRKPPVE